MIVCGVDPGGTAGLVALAVDDDTPGDAARWRWIGSAVITKSARTHATKAENALTLYWHAAKIIKAWGAVVCAIERPADARPYWKGQDQKGHGGGTLFGIGEAYGMIAAAAAVAGCRVYDYAVTSRAAKPGKPSRTGWMPTTRTGNLTHVLQREELLVRLHLRSVALRARPANGMLSADRADNLDQNILMALGVLLFHLSRQLR